MIPAVLLSALLSGCFRDRFFRGETGFTFTDTSSTTDEDRDGYSPRQGDCDDNDANLNPGEAETVNDGVDSNCDGEDDT